MGVSLSPAFFISGTEYKLRLNKSIVPNTSDGAAIGTSSLMWSDLFLASGGVINFNNGDVTVTHGSNTLSFAGASSDYSFDADIVLANAKGFAIKDNGGTKAVMLVRNNNNDAHFLANVTSGNSYGLFNNSTAFSIGGSCCGGSPPSSLAFNTSGATSFKVSDSTKVTFSTAGNVKVGGTANRGTTEGSNQLVLFNGTAPAGTLTDGVSFYSASGEARVMDAAGNNTLLSPHDKKTNEWIFHSVNTNTGEVLRIDMERLMRKLDELFGGGFIHEFVRGSHA